MTLKGYLGGKIYLICDRKGHDDIAGYLELLYDSMITFTFMSLTYFAL